MIEYRFEEIQDLKFVVYDIDDRKHVDNPNNQEIIGEMTCMLADILASGQHYERKVRHKGNMCSVNAIADEVIVNEGLGVEIVWVCELLSEGLLWTRELHEAN